MVNVTLSDTQAIPALLRKIPELEFLELAVEELVEEAAQDLAVELQGLALDLAVEIVLELAVGDLLAVDAHRDVGRDGRLAAAPGGEQGQA
mgnify:CR=1 FL=1